MRNYEIDYLKAFGIFFVFLGHNHGLENEITRYIFSFHIPLFFIAAGVFFKFDEPFQDFFVKKVRTVLVPYFLFWIIAYLIKGIEISVQGDFSLWSYISFAFKHIWFGLKYYATGLWFLLVLFMSIIVFYLFGRFIGKKSMLRYFAFIVVLGGLAHLADSNGLHRVPFRYSTVPIATLFITIGYVFREKLINFKPNFWMAFLSFLIGYLLFEVNGNISLASTRYHNVLLAVLGATSTTIFWLTICKSLGEVKFLKFIGVNSLIYFTLCDSLIRYYVLQPLSGAGYFIMNEGMGSVIIWACAQIIIGIPIVFFINKWAPWIVGKKSKISRKEDNSKAAIV